MPGIMYSEHMKNICIDTDLMVDAIVNTPAHTTDNSDDVTRTVHALHHGATTAGLTVSTHTCRTLYLAVDTIATTLITGMVTYLVDRDAPDDALYSDASGHARNISRALVAALILATALADQFHDMTDAIDVYMDGSAWRSRQYAPDMRRIAVTARMFVAGIGHATA